MLADIYDGVGVRMSEEVKVNVNVGGSAGDDVDVLREMIETIHHEIGVLGVNEGAEDAGCGDGTRMCHALLTITYTDGRVASNLLNLHQGQMTNMIHDIGRTLSNTKDIGEWINGIQNISKASLQTFVDSFERIKAEFESYDINQKK